MRSAFLILSALLVGAVVSEEVARSVHSFFFGLSSGARTLIVGVIRNAVYSHVMST